MMTADESSDQAVPPSLIAPRNLARCPEASMRASMTDEEFWAHVFRPNEDYYDSYPDDEDLEDEQGVDSPCKLCGEYICGYDYEGRPMSHMITMGIDE